MTPGTFKANGSLMYIIMTIRTLTFSIFEDQCWVTLPAIGTGMLSGERKGGGIMIKRIYRPVKIPSFGTMTGATADFKIRSVRLNLWTALHNRQKIQYQE
jgi:hypothetical protein